MPTVDPSVLLKVGAAVAAVAVVSAGVVFLPGLLSFGGPGGETDAAKTDRLVGLLEGLAETHPENPPPVLLEGLRKQSAEIQASVAANGGPSEVADFHRDVFSGLLADGGWSPEAVAEARSRWGAVWQRIGD